MHPDYIPTIFPTLTEKEKAKAKAKAERKLVRAHSKAQNVKSKPNLSSSASTVQEMKLVAEANDPLAS